jgi:lipid-A-disaccharide synthase-like uncharacterized protein
MSFFSILYADIVFLFNIPLGQFGGISMDSGKVVGYFGVALFSSRWLLQMGASKKSGKPVLPCLFWYVSIAGSFCLLSYFTFGKNDSVGILSNLFPMSVALYNLYLEFRYRKTLNEEHAES